MSTPTNPPPRPTRAEPDADPYRGGLRVAFDAGAHLTVETDGRPAAVEWAPRREGDATPWRTVFGSRHYSAQIAVTKPGDPHPVPLTTDELCAMVRRTVRPLAELRVTPDAHRAGVFVLGALRVRDAHRDRGHEDRAMRLIVDWAELFAATLAVPPGAGRPDRWLARFGFAAGRDGGLVRHPARRRPPRDIAHPVPVLAPAPRRREPPVPDAAPATATAVAVPRGVEDVYADLRQFRSDVAGITDRIAKVEAGDDAEWVTALETQRDDILAALTRVALELDDLARQGVLPSAWLPSTVAAA